MRKDFALPALALVGGAAGFAFFLPKEFLYGSV